MIIPPNKKRIPIGMFVGLIIFGVIFYIIISMWRQPEEPEINKIINVILLIAILISVGFIAILSFLDYIKLVFNKNSCLTITENGINDNLGVISVGSISWTEITEIRLEQKFQRYFLIIQVTDPQYIINRHCFLKRRMLKSLLRKFNSPVVIFQKSIDYDLLELKDIIDKKRPI